MTFIVIARTRTRTDRDRGSGGQFGSHVEHVLSIYDYEIAIYRESETGLNKWSSQNLSYVKEVLVLIISGQHVVVVCKPTTIQRKTLLCLQMAPSFSAKLRNFERTFCYHYEHQQSYYQCRGWGT